MPSVFRFADFELNPARRQLMQRGQTLQVGGRAMDLLLLLIAQRHRTVDKAELIDHCWPGQAVEPNNLAVQVWALRRLLGNEVIATVPGRGYQFIAATHETPTAQPPTANTTTLAAAPPLPLLSSMFGRDADLAQLLALLQQHRLLTLLGPPGVGKTRLAQAVVAAWVAAGDAALLVDLATVADAAGLETAVRLALGLADSGPSHQTDNAWMVLLAEQRLLLVLDNCEHLAAALARLAAALLAHAPGLRLLATSQRPLGLPAEQQLRLHPLPVPINADPANAQANPALQLLLARVRALDQGFALADGDLPAAVDLCRQLDGLPLAIELAAVRVPTLGLHGVHARLGDRLRLLARVGASQRHATLADALAWSVSLLAPPQQHLLHALGVCNGSFGIDLALQLGQASGLAEWAVLDGLGQLADHSLLVSVAPGDPHRLRLLETTRAYALAQLQTRGELERLRQCHAEAVCALLARDGQAREAGRLSGDQALNGVRLELDNIRVAMDWALAAPERAPVGHSLVSDAWPAMMFMGLYHEATRWMLALLPHLAANTPPRTAGFMLLGLGKLALRLSDLAPLARHAWLLQAQTLLDTLPRYEYAMAVRQTLAQSACQLGDAQAALATTDTALALLQRGDMASYRADLTVWRGIALALLGRRVEAEAAHTQALPLCVPEGNGDFLFMLLCDLAELEGLLGQHAAAAGRLQFLTQAATARGVPSHVVAPLWAGLQASLLALGDVAGARSAAAEVRRHMAALGCPLEGCHLHAWLLALEGQPQQAMWLVGAGDRQVRETGETRLLCEPTARRAALALLQSPVGDDAMLESWRRHGETLTPTEMATLLFGSSG